MRIQDVSKQTGLTKKAIHFYINEGLIHPVKLENNYYEFSKSDLDVLLQIVSFRKAGISIQTIKEIYAYPGASNFYLHRSFNQMKQEIAEKMMQLENLEIILNTIPPNGTPFDVAAIPQDHLKQIPNTSFLNQMHPSIDERMIAILLLAPFMDVPVDEYKYFLWDKIFSDLKYQFKDNLSVFSNLIYSLSGNQIRESSTFQFNLMKELSESSEIEPYVDYLISCIHHIMEDKELRQKWILLHDPVINPVKLFFKRTTEKKRITQYNPRFEQCTNRMIAIIEKTIQKLTSEEQNQLIECLEHHFNFNEANYSDLFILFTFHKSIYAMCSLKQIHEALKK